MTRLWAVFASMPAHQFMFIGLMAAAFIYAVVWGGAPERLVAASLLGAMVLTLSVAKPVYAAYRSVEWDVFAIDVGLLIVLLTIALRSTRFWLMPLVSLQIIDVLGHTARALDPGIMIGGYTALVASVAYPMVALVAIGTWRHRRRLRCLGIDYSWVSELPPAYLQGWTVDEVAKPSSQADT